MEGLFVYIIALAVFLCFSAFFSGSEAALFSLSRTQIRRMEALSSAGKEISALLAKPRRLLTTILLGNLFVNIASTSLVTSLSINTFGDRGVVIAFVGMSFLLLIFGEIFPKVVALNRPESFSRVVIYPMKFFHKMFSPIRYPLANFADSVINILTRHLGRAKKFFSADELATAVDIGLKEGVLDKFEHEVLSNVLEFRDKIVKEIMTPSIDVFSLPINIEKEDLLDKVRRCGFSRIPIYDGSPDDIKGILHIKDVMKIEQAEGLDSIETFLRKPFHVPETARISGLFKQLVAEKTHMAVAFDEYGSFVGIVTMEDILEELIGEIRDAREPVANEYHLLDDHRIIILGTVEIDKFNEIFGTDIRDEEHETMAGYLIGVTGTIPNEGETITVGNLRFHIISTQPNRIRKMRVEKL